MKRYLTGCLLIMLAAAALATAQTPPAAGSQAAPATPQAAAQAPAYTPPQKTSEEFSYCTYKATAGEYTILVYSWLAMWREAEPFFPVVVAVGRSGAPRVKGETKEQKKVAEESVIVDLSNFTLTDSKGNIYSPASYEDITTKYKFLLDDKNMLAEEPMVTTGAFPDIAPESLAFYPVDGGGRMRGTAAELDNYTGFESSIYFPKPAAGYGGIMTLTMTNAKIGAPISVNFKIPVEKEKKKKDKDKDKK
jgi:hypothetical protein